MRFRLLVSWTILTLVVVFTGFITILDAMTGEWATLIIVILLYLAIREIINTYYLKKQHHENNRKI